MISSPSYIADDEGVSFTNNIVHQSLDEKSFSSLGKLILTIMKDLGNCPVPEKWRRRNTVTTVFSRKTEIVSLGDGLQKIK